MEFHCDIPLILKLIIGMGGRGERFDRISKILNLAIHKRVHLALNYSTIIEIQQIAYHHTMGLM